MLGPTEQKSQTKNEKNNITKGTKDKTNNNHNLFANQFLNR